MLNKIVAHSYSVEVYDRKYDGYVAWGVSYDNKEECLQRIKKYCKECLEIWNKYRNDENDDNCPALYYLHQYEDFTQHPITLIDKKYITEVETKAEQINIL